MSTPQQQPGQSPVPVGTPAGNSSYGMMSPPQVAAGGATGIPMGQAAPVQSMAAIGVDSTGVSTVVVMSTGSREVRSGGTKADLSGVVLFVFARLGSNNDELIFTSVTSPLGLPSIVSHPGLVPVTLTDFPDTLVSSWSGQCSPRSLPSPGPSPKPRSSPIGISNTAVSTTDSSSTRTFERRNKRYRR